MLVMVPRTLVSRINTSALRATRIVMPADHSPRRYRHHGQSRQSQRQGCSQARPTYSSRRARSTRSIVSVATSMSRSLPLAPAAITTLIAWSSARVRVFTATDVSASTFTASCEPSTMCNQRPSARRAIPVLQQGSHRPYPRSTTQRPFARSLSMPTRLPNDGSGRPLRGGTNGCG
jgi:hypothetical protein